jgi:hypothetical protein
MYLLSIYPSPGASSPVAASATIFTGARYTTPEESSGDILYVFEDRLTMDGASVMHPGSSTYTRSAAQCPGAVAAQDHDTAKIGK